MYMGSEKFTLEGQQLSRMEKPMESESQEALEEDKAPILHEEDAAPISDDKEVEASEDLEGNIDPKRYTKQKELVKCRVINSQAASHINLSQKYGIQLAGMNGGAASLSGSGDTSQAPMPRGATSRDSVTQVEVVMTTFRVCQPKKLRQAGKNKYETLHRPTAPRVRHLRLRCFVTGCFGNTSVNIAQSARDHGILPGNIVASTEIFAIREISNRSPGTRAGKLGT
ncbi:hypothetical protein N7471_005696 [Penicillium samsonianum]|uniref:uncharacterized protein n=1 Tax=Penicillium samsonianum TaxID=1882272 RepID=UPI002549B0B9|nr:uncharacterized protein N7471_005696 [Penicillium samsonianum]KAJ6139210.1 hypothetical protein N7471_005696 [Penicillium samsonianum]